MSDSCPSKELLVTVLYGEAGPDEQAAFQAHLLACADCRDEVEALGGVRALLHEWEAPQLHSNFRIVSEPAETGPHAPANVVAGPARWWSTGAARWAGMAAAAMVVLGVSAGIANLDVTVGSDGLRIRTGWSRTQAAPAEVATREAAQPSPASQVSASPASLTSQGETPWRAELAALEQRMRQELSQSMASHGAAAPAAVPASLGARGSDEAFLRRVQALIDQAETRQQQNLALRMTELARDFDMQRKADFVQIQQGLGRAEAEAARTQQMMNYLVRTASTTPR